MTKPIAYITGYHNGYPVVQPTDGAAVLTTGMALYDHPAPDVQPVGKFAKFTDGIWREVTKGSAGVPLYTHPPAADVQELVEPVALEKVYETIVQWDESGGKRSRRKLAKQIIDLYTNTPAADVAELMAQEREACAKVCESFGDEWQCQSTTSEIATAIRARGGK